MADAKRDSNRVPSIIAANTAGTSTVQITGASLASSTPLHVAIVDTTGAQTVNLGGTQYTEADTDASITGTAALMEAGSNTLVPLQGDTTNGLLVNLGTNNDVTVTSISAGDNNIGNVDIASALPAGTNAIGKLAANSGVDIGDVDVTSIAAGDNNIGNVDIISLPAGNLGMQLMAASLSTVPASNITDATYIGDIKFGESLPAGTNAIGKLAANSGVDIGDVDIASIAAGDNNIGNVDIVTMPTVTVQQSTGTNLHVVVDSGSISTDTELTTADLDTGAGTDTKSVTGLLGAGDGGGQVIPGDTTNGLLVNLGSNNDVTVTAISAGDNNIGNVDVASLPAGNLGMQLMAASLSTVPASNITDATYIGDIKFGEALPVGSNAIGKLAANSGVDIGDVDVTSISAGDNNIGNVDIVTVPSDPFGANADAASATGSISAKLRYLAGTGIAGMTALPAGTNAIGKLAANSGVDIGDIDVTSVIPGTGATNLGKAIDTATGATDTGVLTLATRDDALSALTPLEGDNIQLRVDANGALWTHDDALDAALGGTELQVDVVASLPAGTNAIGKLAANSGVDIGDVDVTSISAGDNNIGNVDIVTVPAPLSTTGAGTEATALRVTVATDSTGVLSVDDNGGAITVDNGGTFAVQDATAQASLSVMDDWDNAASDGASVSGDTAHDAADAGEPVKLGAKAVASLDDATMVAANDRTNLYADLDGVLITKNGCPNADIIMERVSNTDGAATALTNFGATASTYNIITDIIVHNAHTSTNGYVDIRDGVAGTVIATIPLPANGGAVINLKTPLRSTANTAMAFDVSAAITTIYLTFIGYKSKA